MTFPVEAVRVFDLDGTVLKVNSFPLWVRYLLNGGSSGSGTRARLGLTLRVGLALARRKLTGQPHRLFKQRLQDLASGDAVDRAFIDRLLTHVEPQLTPYVQQVVSGTADGVLATAAVEEYALALGGRLGFEVVLATPRRRSATQENVGQAKRDSVRKFLELKGWQHRPLVVFTDHLEDEPLVSLATYLVWCGNPQECRKLKDLYPSIVAAWCTK